MFTGVILGHQLVKQLFQNSPHVLFGIQPLSDPIYHLLISFDLPDAIAPHDYEVEVFVLYLFNVGVGSDHLAFGGQISIALIL